MRISGKTVVITGAGGGIGRELVAGALRRGGVVAGVDLDENRLAATAETVRAPAGRLSTHLLDVTDRAAVKALPDQVLTAHGQIDCLINNAGVIQPFVPLIELDDASIDRMIDINLRGTIDMCRAFLPHLVERPSAHIANVSSMGGFLPVPGQSIYGAAKAGVRLLTEALYAELLDTPVGVTVVMPGGIATDITANSGVRMPTDVSSEGSHLPVTSARDAATAILDAIEADDLHVHIGMDSKLMQIAVKVAPKSAVKLLRNQMADLLDG